MKLCTYTAQGQTRTGIVVDDTVIDTGVPGTMIDLIRDWDTLKPQLEARAAASGGVPLASVKLEAPVQRPGKIFAIGLNYADHIAESKMETPQQQVWFTKAQTSVNGPYDPILIARGAFTNDYEAEMVAVEHILGKRQIVLDLGLLGPGQLGEHVDVVAHHGGFGRHGRHELELLEFAIGLLARVGRHPGGLDLFLDLLDVGALFALAELLLDGLDLLVQVEVALVLLHLALDAAADFLVHIENVHLALELAEQFLQPRLHIVQLEHGLLVLELERQMRGDGVHQSPHVVDAGD